MTDSARSDPARSNNRQLLESGLNSLYQSTSAISALCRELRRRAALQYNNCLTINVLPAEILAEIFSQTDDGHVGRKLVLTHVCTQSTRASYFKGTSEAPANFRSTTPPLFPLELIKSSLHYNRH